MPNKDSLPSKAEFLADLVTGDTALFQMGATVQRSHRFPLLLFTQMENLARMGGVPVSVIINQLLDCGLDAVLKELPAKVVAEVKIVSSKQLDRKFVGERVDVVSTERAAKQKAARSK